MIFPLGTNAESSHTLYRLINSLAPFPLYFAGPLHRSPANSLYFYTYGPPLFALLACSIREAIDKVRQPLEPLLRLVQSFLGPTAPFTIHYYTRPNLHSCRSSCAKIGVSTSRNHGNRKLHHGE
ncbi:hypothetical protein K469DRAFT_70547 [Zopfia rhizophila CBS 207.26]|uniref:Uncharacterized protein n=1 Tax=Zopfia rhizophila CBS 207.26 TaxID=1314779 RepID=A0A6A6EDW8_9PEZI|nr:hypothetical protein K469DRAFT_70547 [Zopfia rhizophila CBS 207.26]